MYIDCPELIGNLVVVCSAVSTTWKVQNRIQHTNIAGQYIAEARENTCSSILTRSIMQWSKPSVISLVLKKSSRGDLYACMHALAP